MAYRLRPAASGRTGTAVAPPTRKACADDGRARRIQGGPMSVSMAEGREAFDLRSYVTRARVRRVVEFVAGPALLIGAWWVAYAGTLVDPNLLPSPFATIADTWNNIVTGKMTKDFVSTTLRVSYAFAIAAAAGVPVGIVLGA